MSALAVLVCRILLTLAAAAGTVSCAAGSASLAGIPVAVERRLSRRLMGVGLNSLGAGLTMFCGSLLYMSLALGGAPLINGAGLSDWPRAAMYAAVALVAVAGVALGWSVWGIRKRYQSHGEAILEDTHS